MSELKQTDISQQLRDWSDHLALPLEVSEVMRAAADELDRRAQPEADSAQLCLLMCGE